MKKQQKTAFFCQNCGYESPKWVGKCPGCGEWNRFAEEPTKATDSRVPPEYQLNEKPRSIDTVEADDKARLKTGLEEMDRVLGGGIVAGSAILVGGDPGIGKSTLLLQVLHRLASGGRKVLYVTGEESASQIKLRADRIGAASKGLYVLVEVALENILKYIKEVGPDVVVIDSIQTVYCSLLSSAPGSVGQVREASERLIIFAKKTGIPVFLVGHVTKDGSIAGPKVLEHMVDTVLYFEGDPHSSFRLVRAVKNRYGAVNELGVFAMTDRGLRAVANPSALFLSQHDAQVPGSCVLVTQEGTRPLLVEIQALVDTAHVPNPRRLAVGLEPQRLALLLAVLHRHAGIATFDQDVFVNAVGGVRIEEPAADLAVLAAIVSSIRNKPLPRGLVAFGEVGLAGEVRPAPRGQERLREAAKLGFSLAIIPKANAPKQPIEGMTIVAVDRLTDAIERVR